MAQYASPKSVYDDIWKEYLENKDGSINKFNLIEVMYEYSAVLHNNGILYGFITNGEITDPTEAITSVIEAHDRHVAGVVDGALSSLASDIVEVIRDEDDDTLALHKIETMLDDILFGQGPASRAVSGTEVVQDDSSGD